MTKKITWILLLFVIFILFIVFYKVVVVLVIGSSASVLLGYFILFVKTIINGRK